MTKALIQQLRDALPKVSKHEAAFCVAGTADIREAADLIEQQAREIEALRAACQNSRAVIAADRGEK